ncbi:hypothetical protein CBOM_06056 [Ceraceosorus bombacis]|uniref:Uncharacterized protein n=1 Tax=Ceraceosorus bombacis TaxID=401625 RepID=A0A0P1BJG1_9BASI|nr:hypothetical protein CBOM_06056 [Ceraceosorus bombacis]
MALSGNHGVLAVPLVLEARNEFTEAAKGLERTLSGSGSHQAEVGLVERPSTTSTLAHDHDHQPASRSMYAGLGVGGFGLGTYHLSKAFINADEERRKQRQAANEQVIADFITNLKAQQPDGKSF